MDFPFIEMGRSRFWREIKSVVLDVYTGDLIWDIVLDT